MKSSKTFFILAFLLLIGIREGNAQPTTITYFDFNVVEPLPALDFAGFVVSNDLTGTPEIFRVQMAPAGVQVYLHGKMTWRDVNKTIFEDIVEFTTIPFSARSFTNRQLGTGELRVQNSTVQESVIRRNLDKGKPTGEYELTLELFYANGSPAWPTITKRLTFLNPSQTLSLISPAQGSSWDPGTVLATWTSLQGVSEYKIRANVRLNPNQSLEDALAQGNPIINDRTVGVATSVNLRTILDREWQGGKEIVLQVTGIVPGAGGTAKVSSPIVSFYLNAPNNAQIQQQNAVLAQLISQFPPAVQSMLQQYLNSTTPLQLNGILNENGAMLTTAELQAIFTYLQQNPQSIVNITVTPLN